MRSTSEKEGRQPFSVKLSCVQTEHHKPAFKLDWEESRCCYDNPAPLTGDGRGRGDCGRSCPAAEVCGTRPQLTQICPRTHRPLFNPRLPFRHWQGVLKGLNFKGSRPLHKMNCFSESIWRKNKNIHAGCSKRGCSFS